MYERVRNGQQQSANGITVLIFHLNLIMRWRCPAAGAAPTHTHTAAHTHTQAPTHAHTCTGYYQFFVTLGPVCQLIDLPNSILQFN